MAQNNKKTPARANAKTAGKSAASGAAKSIAKPASSHGARPVEAKAGVKAGAGVSATIKKPIPVGKTSPSIAHPKLATKATVSKVDMPKTAAKKAEAMKPALVKSAVAKAPVKPVVLGKPAAPAIPAAIAAKPVSAPASAVTKPAPTAVRPPLVTAKPVSAGPFKPAPKLVPAVSSSAPAAVSSGAPLVRAVAPLVAKPVVAPAAAVDAGPKKTVSSRHGFKTNEWIVYPAHGVGRIVAIDEQEIAGMALELFVITFEKDKLTLRVPTGKAQQVGMRKLAEDGEVRRALETLKGKARIKRTMWSRRAQEFEAKINSGNLTSIAEVVRDLYRAENQPEQSYSERQLYEAALDRMAREIAAVDKIDERGASQRIVDVLSKSAKGRKAAGEEAAAAAAADGDDEAVQAA